MSAKHINELLAACKRSGVAVEVCGGSVIAVIDGRKTVLGGPQVEGNTFHVTEAGQSVLEVKQEKRKPKKDEITEDADLTSGLDLK